MDVSAGCGFIVCSVYVQQRENDENYYRKCSYDLFCKLKTGIFQFRDLNKKVVKEVVGHLL